MYCYVCKCFDYHNNTAGDQTLVSSSYTVTLLTDLPIHSYRTEGLIASREEEVLNIHSS
jgi:hypothetical protein